MRLTLTLFLILLAQMVWSTEIRAQTPEPACPAVKVEPKFNNPAWAGALVTGDACRGSIVTFNAVVSGIDQKEKPTFEWTISNGNIIEGQGTPAIKVATDEVNGEVEATVNIRFGSTVNPECNMTASATISVGDCHPPCPSLSMNCPTGMRQPGEPVTFSIDVSGGPLDLNLKYNWQLSAGTITSGQGTPAITVDTTGLAAQAVTATVEVGGIPPECESRRSCTLGSGHLPLPARKYDEYSDVSRESEETRLADFAIQLENEPGTEGYVFIYGQSGVSKHLSRVHKLLVEKHRIDASRIKLENGGYNRKTKVELWLAPPGSDPPKPSPNF